MTVLRRQSTKVLWVTLALYWACGNADQPEPIAQQIAQQAVEIRFEARSADQLVSCSAPFFIGSKAFELHDLRLFVHDVALVGSTGEAVPLSLSNDGVWQTDSVALLDFEDASESCLNGSLPTNTTIVGTVPPGDYTGLRFRVGVPFEQNHENPAQAEGPLTAMAMHWGWQAGYKFLRVDWSNGQANFRVHLGSTGCQGTMGNISSCDRENRPQIEFADFDPALDTVVFDLALLSGTGDGDCQAAAEP
ncbi:MAG: metallo-mystery pair system four-Cys motif protein, partial [Myxococcales bacterium]|nr:metallo-mystery pair system four-Cys motif protein [Myxococcales bacterium]